MRYTRGTASEDVAMISRRSFGRLLAGVAATALLGRHLSLGPLHAAAQSGKRFPVMKTDAEWHKLLTPAQYDVLREEGTEQPFTSPLNGEHRKGVFSCAGCEQQAFLSETKFDSGTGWPSFYAPIEGAVETTDDRSFGMVRTKVACSRCGGHLGHVFRDGPKPTGLR